MLQGTDAAGQGAHGLGAACRFSRDLACPRDAGARLEASFLTCSLLVA